MYPVCTGMPSNKPLERAYTNTSRPDKRASASRSAPSRSAHLGEDEGNCLEHPVV